MVKNIKNKIIKDSFDGYKNFRLVLLKLKILFIISNLPCKIFTIVKNVYPIYNFLCCKYFI